MTPMFDMRRSERWLDSRFARAVAIAVLMLVFFVLRAPYAATHTDFARDAFVAQRLLAGVQWPLSGPVLAGTIHLGPVWYYLLAAAAWIGRSWLGMTAIVFALASTQLPLAYLAGKALHSRRAGMLWALGLLAPSWSTFELLIPLHYLFSAPLVLAVIVSAVRCLDKPRLKYLVALALGFVLAVHAHPSNAGLAWLVAGVVVVLWRRRALRARDAAIACAVASIPLLPYFVWDWLHGFADLRAGLAYIGDAGQTGHLSAVGAIFAAVVWGGPRYWLHDLLHWPAPAEYLGLALVVAFALLGASGFARALASPRRARLLGALAVFFATLCTVAMLRALTPFYMTTAVRVEWIGLVAVGLAWLGVQAWSRIAQAAFAASSVGVGLLASVAVVRVQTQGAFPFATLPMFHVPAAAQPAQPLLLTAAYAMPAVGRFLCDVPALSLHGAFAQAVGYDYAIAQRFACDRADVHLTGSEPERQHWIGLSRNFLARLDIEPERRIGPIGLLRAQPVAPVAPLLAPDEPVYPALRAAPIVPTTRHFRIELAPGAHAAITNMAFLQTADAQVQATLDGRAINASAQDAITRAYACDGCGSAGAVLELTVTFTDFAFLDIVTF